MFNHKVALKATVTSANPGPAAVSESAYGSVKTVTRLIYTEYIEPFKSTSQELALISRPTEACISFSKCGILNT